MLVEVHWPEINISYVCLYDFQVLSDVAKSGRDGHDGQQYFFFTETL